MPPKASKYIPCDPNKIEIKLDGKSFTMKDMYDHWIEFRGTDPALQANFTKKFPGWEWPMKGNPRRLRNPPLPPTTSASSSTTPAPPPKAATPPPAPPAVASPSPALSYASLEGNILKRPHSPGSSSSGSSRAASVIDVDMDNTETGSQCPTPTIASARVGIPAPHTFSSAGLPAVNTTLSSLDMSRATTPVPLAPAARPTSPLPRVDTPVPHAQPQPQPPAPVIDKPCPIDGITWGEFLNALEVVIPAISECPANLMTRFYDLAVNVQSATVKFRTQPPPKKKVRVTPASPSKPAPAPTPAAASTPSEAMSAPAPKKAVAAPPSLSTRPDPKAAPAVSVKSTRKRRQGKHTAHGASRRGIILTPPAGSAITAAAFTPEVLNGLNVKLEKDLKAEICLTHATDGQGIFIAATRVPTASETAFVLKHVRRLFPSPAGSAITSSSASSTSFLKIIDVPILSPDPMTKDWVTPTRAALKAALKASPVGSSLTDVIKHEIRLMRVSAHSDSCIAWVDINDTVSGTNSRTFISEFVSVGGVNCRILGAKPHSGSVLCTRCQRWGHHSSQCRRLGVRCAHCGGPHTEANHHSMVDAARVDQRTCVNCVATKRSKHAHSTTDRAACPFWKHRFDRAWLKRQFQAPSDAIKARSGPSV